MKCHYEVLEIERTATDEQIKKSYRKLALKWHPDKNRDNIAECTEYFAVIQQAYDVLGDAHERSWYDRHRDAILKGGIGEHYEDKSLNLFPYFSTTCFSGFGDTEKGYYAVYRDVFDNLAAEELEFLPDSTKDDFPSFGNSDSDYDEELVIFVRKRDKRVQAYRKVLEQKKEEQLQKAKDHQKAQIRRGLENIGEHKETEENKALRESQLRDVELALKDQFGDDWSSDEDSETSSSDGTEESLKPPQTSSEQKDTLDSPEQEAERLYCFACEKKFKNLKAMENHEKSKKHKDAVEILKHHLEEEELALLVRNSDISTNGHPPHTQSPTTTKTGGRKSKKQKRKQRKVETGDDSDEEVVSKDTDVSKDPGDQTNGNESSTNEHATDPNSPNTTTESEVGEQSATSSQTKMGKKGQKSAADTHEPENVGPKPSNCQTCREEFPSKSKLFVHLSETGHATIKTMPQPKQHNKGKNKKRRN